MASPAIGCPEGGDLRFPREPSRPARLVAQAQCRESAMKITTVALIGATAFTLSAAFAQEANKDLSGTLTMIDRVDRNVVIQRPQGGTVGSDGSAPPEWLKVATDQPIDQLHVGDKVTFAISEAGGVKTITKLEKQK